MKHNIDMSACLQLGSWYCNSRCWANMAPSMAFAAAESMHNNCVSRGQTPGHIHVEGDERAIALEGTCKRLASFHMHLDVSHITLKLHIFAVYMFEHVELHVMTGRVVCNCLSQNCVSLTSTL